MTDYLTMAQAAEYLKIKVSYLRRQISLGNAPTHFRPSPRVALFTTADLDAWRDQWQKVTKSA